MDLTSLKQFVDRQTPALDPAEWEAFAAIWKPYQAGRKTLLTRPGEVEKYLYFVLEGVQRAYYLHQETEATVVFTYAPSFSGVADSFLTQTPSRFYLETLTPSQFLRTTFGQLEAVMAQHRPVETWMRLTTARVMAGLLARQAGLLCFSAEEKFKSLLHRSPHLLQLIPHKYLASYLGLDPSTFSKLLAGVRL
jgi:CRP-like cAMP-binding protein